MQDLREEPEGSETSSVAHSPKGTDTFRQADGSALMSYVPGRNSSAGSQRPATDGTDPPSTADSVQEQTRAKQEAIMAEKEEQLRVRVERQEQQRLAHLRVQFEKFDDANAGSIDKERAYEAFIEMGIKVPPMGYSHRAYGPALPWPGSRTMLKLTCWALRTIP